MESLTPLKLIRAGFWIGIGFLIPCVFAYIAVTGLFWWGSTSFVSNTMNEISDPFKGDEAVGQLKIQNYRESIVGSRYIILGSVENTGSKVVKSLSLEAELMDENGQMVYECSEHISGDLKEGEAENFQISCGCGDQQIPDHKTVNVKIADASTAY